MPHELFNPAVYKKTYSLVRAYIICRSGSIEDVQDILQDGFYIFFRKAEKKELDLKCQIESYVLGICKKLWLKELCNRQGKSFTDAFEELEQSVEDEIHQKVSSELLMDIFIRNIKKLSEKCQEVFELRMEGLSCEEIAEKMGLSSEQISRNKAFTCKKRQLDLIYQDPEYIRYFGNKQVT